MKIDEDRRRILIELFKDAMKDGTEMISIGDLEYVFPAEFDEAAEQLQKEI
jgi:hypothetical protein